MQYTDTHCHLQDNRLAETLPDVLARGRSAGVTRFVCCGTSEDDWNNVLDLAAGETGIIPMLGLHPWYVGQAKPGWDERLDTLLRSCHAGVGECGLDFAIQDINSDAQIAALVLQWRMALKLNRPLSLHCRKAFDVIFRLAEKHGLPGRGAVIHAFSGAAEQAKIAVRHGFYISFACSLSNPKNKRARNALTAVPLDRLLLETDSPDISPNPDTLNEPANLVHLHNATSELLDISPETLKKHLENNSDIFEGRLHEIK